MKQIKSSIKFILSDVPFIIAASIYTAVVAFKIYGSPLKGISSIKDASLDALIILFFVFIPIGIIEVLQQKKYLNYNCKFYLIPLSLKAFILSSIPFLLSFFLALRTHPFIDIGSAILPFLIVFLFFFYWLLLINVFTFWLKRAALIIVLLFLFYPALTEYIEGWQSHKLYPFEIVFTIVQKLIKGSTPTLDISLLLLYTSILLIIFMLSLKRICVR